MRANVFTLALLFILLPATSLAHSTGSSLEQEVDGYIIDIGQNPETLVSNEQVTFDFSLFKRPTGAVSWSRVWVRVARGDTTVFAGGIAKSVIGPTTLLTQLPKGEYTLTARYEEGTNILVEATFPLSVLPSGAGIGQSDDSGKIVAFGLGGIALGLVAGFFLMRRRTSPL